MVSRSYADSRIYVVAGRNFSVPAVGIKVKIIDFAVTRIDDSETGKPIYFDFGDDLDQFTCMYQKVFYVKLDCVYKFHVWLFNKVMAGHSSIYIGACMILRSEFTFALHNVSNVRSHIYFLCYFHNLIVGTGALFNPRRTLFGFAMWRNGF